MMKINLLVIRSEVPKELSEFYQKFGLIFDYHKHGNGPYHYSTEVNGIVFEIYPLLKSQTKPDRGLRVGFELQDEEIMKRILGDNTIEVIKHPEETEWGKRCVIKDIEGRKIEIIIKE